MAFPLSTLDIKADLKINGVWTDVTADVFTRDLMTITRGRPDEGARTDPGKTTLTFNNGLSKVAPTVSGRYSPGNPNSDLYGAIGRNTPVRVHLPASTAHLELDGDPSGYVSTPDTAILDITGDIDVRMEFDADITLTALNQTVIGKWGTVNADRSWMVRFINGLMYFLWYDGTGASNQAFQPITLYGGKALRFTLDVNNGAGGLTAQFYQADSIDGPWTAIGDPLVGAATTSIQATSSDLRIGPNDSTTTPPRNPFLGTGTRFQVRSGIDGTLVADADFRPLADGATAFTDSVGRTWTVNGTARVRKRVDRFNGEISSWPARWDVSGKDVWVPVEAAGVLRRYGQGGTVLQSSLRRRVPSYSPLAYWPLEESNQATQASSPIAGVQPLKLTRVNWASADSLPSSAALPVLASAGGALATLRGSVPAPVGTTTGWNVTWVYRLDTAPTTLRTFLRVLGTGTVREWTVQARSTQSRVIGVDADGNTVVDSTIATGADLFGQWTSTSLRTSESGGTVTWTIVWQDVGGDAGQFSSTYSGSAGRVTAVASPDSGFTSDLDGMAIGHIGVFSTTTTDAYLGAITAWQGEQTGERLMRLASEEQIPLGVWGLIAEQEAVGAQTRTELLELLEQCADSDGGILMEHRGRPALRYRGRATLYNQQPALTLSYTTNGEISPPLEPLDDDADVVNDVTVQRIDGSSGHAVLEEGALSVQAPPDGIGTGYDTSVQLSLDRDEQTEPIANWRLHLGTWDAPRYPVVHVNLARAPHLIDAVLGLDQGDMIRLTDLPAWLPPGDCDLIVQGYTESFDQYAWDIQFTCTPAGPWYVGVVGDGILGRANTDGSELAAAATSTATSLTVMTTNGTPWTTSVADLPFDIRVGGEVMQVEPAGTVLTANPTFETDTSGWTATSATLDRSSRIHRVGAWSALLTTGSGSNPRAADALRAVTASSTYTALGWLYAPVALPQLVGVNVNWYNASQTYLSTSSNTASLTPGTWTAFNAQFTAPVGAAYGSILFTVTNTPGAGYLLYADNVKLIAGGTGIKAALKEDFSRSVAAMATDAFTRTTSNGWGNADTGQAWSISGGTAADYATTGTKGTASVGVVNSSRFTALAVSLADLDMQADVTVPVVATGASISTGLRLRSPDTSNYYYIEMIWGTGGTISVQLVSRVAAVSTTIAGPVSKGTYAASDTWTVRARVVGSVLQAKLWKTSTSEPDVWDVEAVTTSLTAAAPVGTRALLSTGNTNTLPVVVSWDNVRVTAVAQGWGTSSSGDAWTTSGGSASEYFVDTIKGEGYIELTTVNSSRRVVTGPSWADTDLLAAFTVPIVAATDSIDPGIMSRYADSGTYYLGTLHFHNDSTVDVRIRENVAGVFTTLSISNLLPGTYSAGSTYWLRFRTQGSNLYARGWAYGTTEPTIWHASTSDTSLTAAGRVGIRANLQVNNTNTPPVTMRIGSFTVDSPQVLTVTRSVNGIVKAQTAGTAVSLANPAHVAL
ncbi:hypothetical protein [Streptomyces cellulosae]|uniref:hypothetical protein n=2 Tax=Streptomyces TaxID=1883 RepID=UPI00068A5862|nr:hypothetical protein [Streptomyces cellulosae]